MDGSASTTGNESASGSDQQMPPSGEFASRWDTVAVLDYMGMSLTLFVLVTIVSFAEKRQQPMSRMHGAFAFSTFASGLIFACSVLFTALPVTPQGSPEIYDRPALCAFQGGVHYYFMSTIVWLWICITHQLKRNLCDHKEVTLRHIYYYLIASYTIPFISVIILLAVHEFEFNGYVCFIKSAKDGAYAQLVVHCIDALVALYGFYLWVLVLLRMLEIRRQAKVAAKLSKESNESLLRSGSSGPKVGAFALAHLLFRQFIFASSMLVIMCLLATIFILDFVGDPHLHRQVSILCTGLAIAILSVIVFLVWGLTQQNARLWKELLCFDRRKSPTEIKFTDAQ